MSVHKFFANLDIRKNQILNFILHKFSTNNDTLTHAGQVGYREDLEKIVYRGAGTNIHKVATEAYADAASSAHTHAIAEITGLQAQLTAIHTLLTSDNVNLDSLQELVDAIETVQTSLSTILVNDLTTGGVSKALTAQQGVALKALIDALTTTVAGKQDSLGFTPYNVSNPNAYVSLATVLATVNVYTKAQGFGIATLTDGATISWDLDVAQSAQVTLAGNRTLANPSNIRNGLNYQLDLIQDGTGNRVITFGTAYKFPNNLVPVLSTTAGAVDVLSCRARNGILQCLLTKGY